MLSQRDGYLHSAFSCSHCALLTEATGWALGSTRPSDIRVVGRLRHPWLRPAAQPVSSVSSASTGTKEGRIQIAISYDPNAICQATTFETDPPGIN